MQIQKGNPAKMTISSRALSTPVDSLSVTRITFRRRSRKHSRRAGNFRPLAFAQLLKTEAQKPQGEARFFDGVETPLRAGNLPQGNIREQLEIGRVNLPVVVQVARASATASSKEQVYQDLNIGGSYQAVAV